MSEATGWYILSTTFWLLVLYLWALGWYCWGKAAGLKESQKLYRESMVKLKRAAAQKDMS
jgi:hypothetical protein